MVADNEQVEDFVEKLNPGKRQRRMDLDVVLIKIDSSYQRPRLSEDRISRLASKFRWDAFRTLTIGIRPDGSYWCVDGQHRLAACRLLGIKRVPCTVFDSDGPTHEAELFDLINGAGQCGMSFETKFRNRLARKVQPYVDIVQFCNSLGLKIGASAGTPLAVSFLQALVGSWTRDTEACKVALTLQKRIVEPMHALDGSVHWGIWWLSHAGVDVVPHSARLCEFGKAGILRQITERALGLNTGRNPATCGFGVLDVINWKKHKKIKIPEGAVDLRCRAWRSELKTE